MRKHLLCLLLLASFAAAANAQPTFAISYSSPTISGPLTGRMFLIVAHTDSIEPRLQVGRYGTQFFGVDFTALKPQQTVGINGSTLGYPINAIQDLPDGDYYIQAVLDKYTGFHRADEHTLWMHMDQWEGQDWRRSPGNLYSKVQKIKIGGTTGVNAPKSRPIALTVDQAIPPITEPADTKWVKHIKIKS